MIKITEPSLGPGSHEPLYPLKENGGQWGLITEQPFQKWEPWAWSIRNPRNTLSPHLAGAEACGCECHGQSALERAFLRNTTESRGSLSSLCATLCWGCVLEVPFPVRSLVESLFLNVPVTTLCLGGCGTEMI